MKPNRNQIEDLVFGGLSIGLSEKALIKSVQFFGFKRCFRVISKFFNAEMVIDDEIYSRHLKKFEDPRTLEEVVQDME